MCMRTMSVACGCVLVTSNIWLRAADSSLLKVLLTSLCCVYSVGFHYGHLALRKSVHWLIYAVLSPLRQSIYKNTTSRSSLQGWELPASLVLLTTVHPLSPSNVITSTCTPTHCGALTQSRISFCSGHHWHPAVYPFTECLKFRYSVVHNSMCSI